MKANWKVALMCIATLAFVACQDKNKPDVPGGGGGGGEEPEFVSKVKVDDNSIAEWATLPANFVFSAVCPQDTVMNGLKSVKVYADALYINLLVDFDRNVVKNLSSVPFHVYLNADNSDATGGYGDEFTDANSEWMLECGIYDLPDAANWNPAVFKWWGNVGEDGWSWTDPSVEHDGSDYWGAIIGEGQMPIAASQLVEGLIEIQILRELIPASWANEFGIGFDIQQSWSSVGILPRGENVEGAYTKAAKLKVKIDK